MNFKTAAAELRIKIKSDTRIASGICTLIGQLKYEGFITARVKAAMHQEMHLELKRRDWHSGFGTYPIAHPTPEVCSIMAFRTPSIHNWDIATEYGRRRLAIAYHLADFLEGVA